MKICFNCNKEFNSDIWICPFCNTSPSSFGKYLSFYSESVPDKEEKGFNRELFNELVFLEDSNFWFRARNRIIIWALKKYFMESNNFLEIGCGTGYVLSGIEKAFPRLSLFGSELFGEGLAVAESRLKNVTLFKMDARKVPFKNEFDVIGAFDVLEHIFKDEIVLQQMFKAIRPGGGALITVPQYQFLWSEADDFACHVRRYDMRELKEKVRATGFRILRTTSFVTLLLPLMVMARLLPRRKDYNYDPLSELRLSKPLNYVFEKCMDFETILIKMGLDMYAGGSLLLIAQKI